MATKKQSVKNAKTTTAKVAVKKEPVAKVASVAVVATPTPQKKKVQNSVKVDVFDVSGKIAETMSLPGVVFGAKVNKQLMAQAVRVYLANQRSGTASTKTRGEVIGSTKKVWRQKGTGRARHGSAKAPLFVHGGVAHGPQPHDFSLTMPQKMRRLALFSALSAKVKDNELKVLSGFEKMEPKTKNFAKFLHSASLDTKKSVLVVLPEKSDNVKKAVRNIEGLSYMMATQLNTYDVLNSSTVLMMKDAVEVMEKHFIKEGK